MIKLKIFRVLSVLPILFCGLVFAQSDLEIQNTVTPTVSSVGSTVTFTLTAKNNGPNNNTNVKVNDKLPSGFQFISKSVASGTTYDETAGIWTIGNLNNGTSKTLTINAKVLVGGISTNFASINTSSGIVDSVLTNNSAFATVDKDSDGDGILDSVDLDVDNDGILNTAENSGCGIPDPEIAPGNGYIVNKLFKEDFGTQSTANGTTSVDLPTVGSGGTTNYKYYKAISGTVPNSTNDGASSPNYSLQDGRYTVFNNIQQTAKFASDVWQNIGDHTGGSATPGTGRMLLVNADLTKGEFYRKTIPGVVPGAPLNASLWAMNLDKDVSSSNGRLLPNITVKFIQNGITVLSYDTGDIPRVALGSFSAWRFYKNSTSFIPTSSAPIDIVLVNNGPGGNGNDVGIDDIIVFQSLCDTDNDGTPNYLDVDSDGDGCPDAIEGSENVASDQVYPLSLPSTDPNYDYRGQIKVIYNGITTNTQPNIVSQSASSLGVPQLVNSAGNNLNSITNPSNLAGVADKTDLPSPKTADIGQGVGDSANAAVSACFCFKNAVTNGNSYPTLQGISSLSRAGADNSNWPMIRQSGWTVLESKTKGFVPNRTNDVSKILNPVEGMIVFDTVADCLKVNTDGTSTGWKCYDTPTCP